MPNAINKCNRNPHENEENNEKNTWKPKSTWKRAWKNKPISKLKKWKTKHANNMEKRKILVGKQELPKIWKKLIFSIEFQFFMCFSFLGFCWGFVEKTHIKKIWKTKNNGKNEQTEQFLQENYVSTCWTSPAFPPILFHSFFTCFSHYSFHLFIWILVFIFSVPFSFGVRFSFFNCIYMFMSSAIYILLSDVFWFYFFIYIFMLWNMFKFHVVFGFVVPAHCVLVSRHAVFCLFPVRVCSYIQTVSFAKSTASFFHFFLAEEQSKHC